MIDSGDNQTIRPRLLSRLLAAGTVVLVLLSFALLADLSVAALALSTIRNTAREMARMAASCGDVATARIAAHATDQMSGGPLPIISRETVNLYSNDFQYVQKPTVATQEPYVCVTCRCTARLPVPLPFLGACLGQRLVSYQCSAVAPMAKAWAPTALPPPQK